MFSFRPEVAEAGKEIEDIIEVIGVKYLSHVVYIEMEVIIFILEGIINAIPGQVDACHIEAFTGQYAGMTSSSAGEVQHSGAGGGMEEGEKMPDEGGSFLFVPFEV